MNDSEETVAAAYPGTDHSPPPINLWLVDDNHRLRTTLMELFGRCQGIKCTAAFASPNEVLSTLASKLGPDVILLDVHMGELNGLDAIRPIKSLSRSTHVLMLTTFFDNESKSRALSDGASGFLLKSFPIETILKSIRDAWSKPAPHPKRKPAQNLVPVPAQNLVPVPALNADSRCAAPETIVTGRNRTSAASDSSRKRSLWVKHCLDLIRNIRN